MSEIDLMAELDDPCPRGCGRSADECDEAEDGEDCAGSPLVRELENGMAKRLRQIEARDETIAELGAANASLIRRVADLENQLAEAQQRANEAARLSATARDEAEDLRATIGELQEHIDIVEGDRLELQEQRHFVLSLCDDAEQVVGRAGFLRVDAIREALDARAGATPVALGNRAASAEWSLVGRDIIEAAKAWRNDGEYSTATRVALVAAVDAYDAAGNGETAQDPWATNDVYTVPCPTCGRMASAYCVNFQGREVYPAHAARYRRLTEPMDVPIHDTPQVEQGGTDGGKRCFQCGEPIEWRDDIDWWVHVDAGNDTHMPLNPRGRHADSRSGQAGGED